MKASIFLCLTATAILTLAGCATSSGVIVNPSVHSAEYHSVFIVVHGGSGADMDANMQKEFLKHGFSVTSGNEGGASTDVQLIARYADDWKWDMAMYLRSLDVMVYDRRTNVLIASGSWKNSVLHGFYSSEKVVANVVDDTLSKISAK